MKTLWTPWRMEHVTGEVASYPGCIFEPPGEDKFNKKHLLLYRNNNCVVLLNRFPYANGHLLIAPNRHVPSISDLTAEEGAAFFSMLQTCSIIIDKLLSPEGQNIGCNIGAAAGAGIADHVHFHIVPRWQEDHNFITVLGDLRTIPEHIDRTFDKLLPAFQNISY